MVGVYLAVVTDVGDHDGGRIGLEGDVVMFDLVDGETDFTVVDGGFGFKIDGYGRLFDEGEPSVGSDEERMGLDRVILDLESGVVEVRIIIYRCVLVVFFGNFYAAGGVPGLLDDDGVFG